MILIYGKSASVLLGLEYDLLPLSALYIILSEFDKLDIANCFFAYSKWGTQAQANMICSLLSLSRIL